MQPRVPRRPWLLGALFLIGLMPRLGLLAARAGDLEFWEYETLARNVAAGNGYVIYRFGHLTLAFGDGNLYSFLAGDLYTVVGNSSVARRRARCGTWAACLNGACCCDAARSNDNWRRATPAAALSTSGSAPDRPG